VCRPVDTEEEGRHPFERHRRFVLAMVRGAGVVPGLVIPARVVPRLVELVYGLLADAVHLAEVALGELVELHQERGAAVAGVGDGDGQGPVDVLPITDAGVAHLGGGNYVNREHSFRRRWPTWRPPFEAI